MALAALAALLLAGAPAFAASAPLVEAPNASVVRIWYKAGHDSVRKPSLALADAPPGRVPLAESLTVRSDSASFSVSGRDGAVLLAGVRVSFSTSTPGAWTLTYPLGRDERLLGLGQDNRNNGRLDRRGTIRELWAGQKIESGNVTAQYPVPFLLSTGRGGRAYGLFFDDTARMTFDLGKTDPDVLRVEADGGELDLYVIDGPKPADVLERYTALTGRPSLPPLWALGYWQSKCTYYDWAQLDEAYRQLTARGFPVDVMVIDADWPEVMTDYRWAPRWLAQKQTPAEKIADYARRGVHIVMSQSGPMVKSESPTFASGWARGVFATDGKGGPVEAGWYGGKLLDFTSPQMNDWLWPQTRVLDESGISGWWLDLTEPEGEPPRTRYHAGSPAEVHNQYSFLSTLSFEGVQLAVHPDRRPFVLTRAGSAGLERHHAAVWTGDVYSDYATLRAHPPEMLNSGLSGFAYWTSDTGGFLVGDYKNDRFGAHARLYERWMQFSAFGPITRAHKAGGVPEPYGLGTATEQGARHYLKLRYRLMPYIYSYAWEASRTGLPLTRALLLEFPGDPGSVAAPGDEYLFGRELLVAPVLREGLANRSVYFPPGKWFDWDDGVEYEGGRDWVVRAPQDRIPVAVRAGAIIPMAPDMKNTGEKPWDPLTVEIYPSGSSSFTLYRDDGASFDYLKGRATVTKIDSDETPSAVRVRIAESNKLFAAKEYVLHLHLRRAPASLKKGWSWDAGARVLTIPLRSGAALEHSASVALSARELPPRLAPVLKADAFDPKGEAAGASGPVPHFFPPSPLPARMKAIYYDNGGEGVAFHATHPLSGADALTGLRAGDWLRYTIDAVTGGYHDLTVRAASASGGRLRFEVQGQAVATVDVPATGGEFRDLAVKDVYLIPGVLTMLVSAETDGLSLDSFALAPSTSAPAAYPAALAARQGPIEAAKDGSVVNLGIKGSRLVFGIGAASAGARMLRLRYGNGGKKSVALSLTVGSEKPRQIALAPSTGERATADFPVTLRRGGDTIALDGLEKGWDTVKLDGLELLPR
ncbi:MAG TPA: TIM-barrel domain-containing protein [Elusimicrobiota bacterium]|nr:TIM-barrel domain-containing protein [Elusimicrobiota bacterium]